MTKPTCGKSLNKAATVCVIALLTFGQQPEVYAGQNASNPGQAARPSKLNIVIVEGEGAINNIQQRVAREVIIQVNDENDRPIGGVLLAFALPASGPGGTFANGANVFSVVSDAAGRATASFTPNTISGPFQMNVTATFQNLTAMAVIKQTNSSSANPEGLSTATIVMIAGAAAAAVAIGVVAARNGGSPAPTPGPTIRIGSGTPTLGAPGGGWTQATSQVSSRPKWRD
jgi:hypothetical protein